MTLTKAMGDKPDDSEITVLRSFVTKLMLLQKLGKVGEMVFYVDGKQR